MIKETTAYDQRHGGPYDRGLADSYYDRGYNPHYYKGDTGTSERVIAKGMTLNEIAAYAAGYRDNEASGDKKDWG
jgi:hypothetical protein